MSDFQAADTSHFNDWPNEQGFGANSEQKTPVELTVTGDIPSYAAGVLYRTGPGRYKVDTEHGNTFQISHWFDGFSQTHRFQLVPPEIPGARMRVFYNSRFSTDDLIEEARITGSLKRFTFGGERDPCKAMYQKVQSTYEPRNEASHSNIGVTLSVNMPGMDNSSSFTEQENGDDRCPHIKALYAKTDNSKYKALHPTTLEPVGLANQATLHPDLNGPLSASHAEFDPQTGDMYNYNLSFAPAPTYRIFRVSAAAGETTILATFQATPAYLHSFFLTSDYVVICIWNSHLSPQDFARGSYIGAIKDFDSSQPAKWYIVDRKHNRGLVAIYNSCAFFCFHTINAWQEPNPDDATETDIVAECVLLENTDTIKRLYYEYLVSSSPFPEAQPSPESRDNGGKTQSKIVRFKLPHISPTSCTSSSDPIETSEALLESTSCLTLAPELPTLNPSFHTRPHRYTYAITDRGYSTFVDGIMKFDSQTQTTNLWSAHAQSPGEPIFVPDPESEEEDDGVLLTVVLDGLSGRSYLLVLDAKTLGEVGRACVEGVVAFGFHGQFVALSG
ncbi:carotenoid oxygenase [Aspergillus cavernicola]|uniref:Carotenoid oxygenase n=1 Tax=Aspergillus cavernicola TaxID=176166 RepID=A0ABR4HTI5_9EURO